MPAMAVNIKVGRMARLQAEGLGMNVEDKQYIGLTKREQFCLKMGVPKTGDPELDEIIKEGNRIKAAGLAMQGLLSANATYGGRTKNEALALNSLQVADALLAELDKSK